MIEPLITIDDIKLYKEISSNTDVTTKVDQYIVEAQEFDVRAVLGDELYLDILDKRENGWAEKTDYKTLFEGGTYTYQDKKYSFAGLKAVLVYYSYARIIPNLNDQVTAFGLVNKTNEFSNRSEDKIIQRKVSQAINGAEIYQRQMIDFLNRNKSTFPLWKGTCVETKTGSFRITAVGGNRKRVGGSHPCKTCGRYSYCNC